MLNLLGFATPAKLGEALSLTNIEDGLLGRIVVTPGRTGVKPRRISGKLTLPASIIDDAERIKTAVTYSCFANLDKGETTGPNAIEIQIAPDADARLSELIVEFDDRRNSAASSFAKALFGRSFEKSERIAGLLAVWDNPMKPIITMEHVAWAEQFIIASDNALVKFSGEFMHGGQVQADAQLILRTIKRITKGDFSPRNANEQQLVNAGLSPWSMVMRTCKLDKKRMDDAVHTLLDLADIEKVFATFKYPNGSKTQVQTLKLGKSL